MKPLKIDRVGAQGDLLIKEIDSIPQGITPVAPVDGRYIAAHSETGHHHIVDAGPNLMWQDPVNPMICYLQANDEFADFVHCRSHDTHQTRRVDGGGKYYQLINQREGNQTLWRRAAD